MRKCLKLVRSLCIALLAVATLPMSSRADSGLVDLTGKIILPIQYKNITSISYDCFRVTPKGIPKDVVPFFVNQRGERIPQPPGVELYDDTGPLAPPPMVPRAADADRYPKLTEINVPGAIMREDLGFGYYMFEKGGFGVCDERGKIIFTPEKINGGSVRPLSRDRFLSFSFNEEPRSIYKLLDQNGNLIANLPTGITIQSQEFHDGLLLVSLEKGGLYGYVNRLGFYQMKPQFIQAEEFNEGFASVTVACHGTNCGALIDTTGRVIAGPFSDGWVEHFENGVAKVTLANKLSGMVASSGAFVIAPEYETLSRIENYIVGSKNKQQFVFSTAGVQISKLPDGIQLWDTVGKDAWSFSFSHTSRDAPTQGNGLDDETSDKYSSGQTLFGIISPSGAILLEPKYSGIYGYSHGYASVSRIKGSGDEAVGLLGPDKTFVIPQIYDSVVRYEDVAVVTKSVKGFDKYDWLPTRDGQINRYHLWRTFLQEFDIIGMKRSKVCELLGDGDFVDSSANSRSKILKYWISQTTRPPHCGNSPDPILEVEFGKNDRVSGWRELDSRVDNQSWNRTNVVYVKQQDDWRLVPKNAAKSYR